MKTEIYTLNQLGTVSRGKSKHRPRNDAILYGGNYPFIQTGDIKHSSMYITEYSQTYNETGLAQSKLWDEDTLCITIAANIAETAILKIKACFPDSIVGFIANKEKADVRFVKYYFDIYKLYMQNISKGTTQDNFSLEKMLRVKFNIPSLSIQQKIANILSRYDEAIENNNKRIKLLEQMAQNLYKEWFVRFRFPGWQNVEFENGIPKGWKVIKVGDYVKIKSGFAFKSEWWQDDGCPVVKIKDIDNGTLDISQLDYVSEEHSRKAKSFLLKEGDLVIAMTGATIGKIGLVPNIANLYTNQRVGKYFLGENSFEKMPILFCLFSQPSTTEMILCLSGASSAQPNISPDQLESIKFFYNEKIVKDFNVKTAPIFKMILKLRENNQNLAKQRDLLLPRLMSGKLEVE